jgi:hypothetical protein
MFHSLWLELKTLALRLIFFGDLVVGDRRHWEGLYGFKRPE